MVTVLLVQLGAMLLVRAAPRVPLVVSVFLLLQPPARSVPPAAMAAELVRLPTLPANTAPLALSTTNLDSLVVDACYAQWVRLPPSQAQTVAGYVLPVAWAAMQPVPVAHLAPSAPLVLTVMPLAHSVHPRASPAR
jgi:hypothetical protein